MEKQNGLRVKERTFITMIDYGLLASERWETASVRKKLHILFVFLEHLVGRPKMEFPITHVTYWAPGGEVEAQSRADWETVRAKVVAGLAHELSEADGGLVGPARKVSTRPALGRSPSAPHPRSREHSP